jgi:lipid II:glycine glycyltransferase (peptidoglycan interpeptide bridge formation enzyme)
MSLQQSPQFANHIKLLNWIVEEIDGTYIYIKKFPILGGLLKIHRCTKFPSIPKIHSLIQTYHVKTLVCEPDENISNELLADWMSKISPYVKINRSPFLPTKTRIIDLTYSEQKLFKSFTQAKQRAVRRAMKNNLIVEVSDDIEKMIKLKAKSAGFMGKMTTTGMKELWKSFGKQHTKMLFAYTHTQKTNISSQALPIAGIFLIFHKDTCYYWIAGATKDGKKLFAPTLLVWESIKLGKTHGCISYDFVGVWDERFPKYGTEWKGFTKFKEGFGGNALYYPIYK